MSRKTILMLLVFLLFAVVTYGADKQFTLVIDAGHGGNDVGAKGSFSYEKNINLNVALAFGRYVEKNCKDVKVIYTRKTDVFVPLHERASIANKNHADVFMSIHTNALPAGRIARGFETYTMGMRRSDEKLSAAKRENSVIMIEKDYKEHYEGYDPNSPESTIMFEFINDKNMAQSIELAKYVQNSVCSTVGRENKGVKQDVFLVLRETSMPACLIELGFITTPDEEKFLNNNDNVEKMAKAIYQAFVQYKNKYNTGGSVPAYVASSDASSKKDDTSSSKETTEKENKKKQDTKNTDKAEKSSKKNGSSKSEVKNQPVFKVQILAASKEVSAGNSQFKGLKNVDSYKENGLVKYTYGASTDYNEIYRLRKSILDKFPQAFIIAFKNGEKMDVNQAISEFKSKKK
ncbi:MAG: N-acetylmuramoyl-L-alanine amidase [Prevotella sp.]|nr:N-acetylmuramoyl-L-alanine amidase [Prevotella sp.]